MLGPARALRAQPFGTLAGPPAAVQPAADYRERLLAARVNSVVHAQAHIMLQAPDGGMLVPADVLSDWGVVVPDAARPVHHGHRAYYPLNAVLGGGANILSTPPSRCL